MPKRKAPHNIESASQRSKRIDRKYAEFTNDEGAILQDPENPHTHGEFFTRADKHLRELTRRKKTASDARMTQGQPDLYGGRRTIRRKKRKQTRKKKHN